MIRNLKDHGDLFEKKAYQVFDQKLKLYIEFRTKYVGNQNGNPEDIPGIIPEEQNKIRLLIAQWNYSILRNLIILDDIYHKCENGKCVGIGRRIKHEIWFLTSVNLFFNNIELISKIWKKLGISSFFSIPGFVEMRNALAHNIKPAVKIRNGYYCVPENFEWFVKQNISNDETWIWSQHDFSGLNTQRLSNFVDWCIEKTYHQFDEVLKKELEYFERVFCGKSLLREVHFTFHEAERTSDVIT